MLPPMSLETPVCLLTAVVGNESITLDRSTAYNLATTVTKLLMTWQLLERDKNYALENRASWALALTTSWYELIFHGSSLNLNISVTFPESYSSLINHSPQLLRHSLLSSSNFFVFKEIHSLIQSIQWVGIKDGETSFASPLKYLWHVGRHPMEQSPGVVPVWIL